MIKDVMRVAAVSLSIVALTGCSSADSSKLATENAELRAKVDVLQSQNEQLESKLAAAQEENGKLTAQQSSSAAAAGDAPADKPLATPAAAATTITFKDIAGTEGEQDIKDLAALGVLSTAGGKFNPSQPVSRAQYVCWLVAANNAYFAADPKNTIRLVEQSSAATFADVPASSPAFKWIQGLANAGYVIGVDSNHFAPDQALTREQMIAIKAQLDEGASIESNEGARMFLPFGDKDQIDKGYLGPISEDTSVRTTNNIARVWGQIKTLNPKNAVTRAEAAVSLSKIGTQYWHRASAADALKNNT